MRVLRALTAWSAACVAFLAFSSLDASAAPASDAASTQFNFKVYVHNSSNHLIGVEYKSPSGPLGYPGPANTCLQGGNSDTLANLRAHGSRTLRLGALVIADQNCPDESQRLSWLIKIYPATGSRVIGTATIYVEVVDHHATYFSVGLLACGRAGHTTCATPGKSVTISY